jgi:hypothetical protein
MPRRCRRTTGDLGKFIYLAPFAAFTGAARLPIDRFGPTPFRARPFCTRSAKSPPSLARAPSSHCRELQRIEAYAADLP